MTYGLRWDIWFPDYALKAGEGGRYDLTGNVVLIPGVGGVSSSANSQTQWHNFSPRLGIAYAVNSKTVIRTGYGRGYSQGTFGWTFNNLAADVYPTIVNQSLSASSPFFPLQSVTTAPPAVVFPTIPSNGRLLLPNGIGVGYIPANQKLPYVDMYSFTVQTEIAPQMTFQVGYVGNVGRHLNGGFDLNSAVPGPGANVNLRQPLYNLYGLTQQIVDKCDCTSSNYNALQLQVKKQFSQSYSILTNFSWQKANDYNQEGIGFPGNPYNVNTIYGPANFDREFALTIAHTVELPFGPGRRFMSNSTGVVRALVANWSFRGITSYYSGLPFNPTLNNSSNLNSDPSTSTLPQLIGNPLSGFSQSRNMWFNPAAYTAPPLYTFGNAGRNSLRGPGFFEADWSLSKGFHFTERTALELRWEVFNAFNNTNLGLPTTAVDSGAGGGIINDIQTGPTSGMRNMQFGAHFTF